LSIKSEEKQKSFFFNNLEYFYKLLLTYEKLKDKQNSGDC
jgi:hypothetical protein